MARAKDREQEQAQAAGGAHADPQAQAEMTAGAQSQQQAGAQTAAGQPQEQRPAAPAAPRVPAARGGPQLWPSRAWSPVWRLFEEFERLFDDMRRTFFGPAFGEEAARLPAPLPELPMAAWTPRVDVRDTGDHVVVSAELPGVEPKDVRVECSDDSLTIQGETRQEETRTEGGVYQSERRYGRFFRRVPLPPGLEADKAQAAFRHGLLTVQIPKSEAARARVRRIPIAAETGGGAQAGGGQAGPAGG